MLPGLTWARKWCPSSVNNYQFAGIKLRERKPVSDQHKCSTLYPNTGTIWKGTYQYKAHYPKSGGLRPLPARLRWETCGVQAAPACSRHQAPANILAAQHRVLLHKEFSPTLTAEASPPSFLFSFSSFRLLFGLGFFSCIPIAQPLRNRTQPGDSHRPDFLLCSPLGRAANPSY